MGSENKSRVMDIREICAASDRTRFRDFYDLALIFQYYSLALCRKVPGLYFSFLKCSLDQCLHMSKTANAKVKTCRLSKNSIFTKQVYIIMIFGKL